jgi:hypothetical protein
LAGDPGGGSALNPLATHPPSVPPNHPSGTASPASSSDPQSAKTLSAWQNYDGGAGTIVRSASLSGTANGGEIHVEFRSGALGPLEVRAVMHDGSVGAEIHVQGQEAHTLLAAGLPSLERALGERNVHVENISVYQGNTGGNMGEGTGSHSGSPQTPPRHLAPWDSSPQSSRKSSTDSEEEESANPAAGLSVRA